MDAPSAEAFARYLDSLLDERQDRVEIELPRPVCVAFLSLMDYLMDNPDPVIPVELRPATVRLAHEVAIKVNPTLGS
jgi:hypothetical protein